MRSASVDFSDIGSIGTWLIGQWWAWVAAVVILVFLVWLFIPTRKPVRAKEGFPTEGLEANEIALGYIQLQNPLLAWNDPTGSELTKPEKKGLVSQWGLTSTSEWAATIERLVTDRRRRNDWQIYLQVRRDLKERLGRAPSRKEWLDGIVQAGGTGKGPDKTFVTAVMWVEERAQKEGGKIPEDVIVTSFDGYAFGQAVAVAVWGVGLGLVTEEDARRAIHQINDLARPEFSSWQEFGVSYVVGRAMHWTDGSINSKSWEKYQDAAHELSVALSTVRQGPWTRLPWVR